MEATLALKNAKPVAQHLADRVVASESDFDYLLTPECMNFVLSLHDEFAEERERLLALRASRVVALKSGGTLNQPSHTRTIREAHWQVARAPHDLQKRHVEITGPAEPKMIINALNSGADVFMADFEDALSPTWLNIMAGQDALYKAVRRELKITSPEKSYELNAKLATLKVRPRGWHLKEKNVLVDGQQISASLFDFGVYFFHNAKELIARGSGPYFYIPKIESHLEARLWNSIFVYAQDLLGIPQGSIRATVLIETLPAAFEMEEILFELKEHSAGLNAGRWDYLFSMIKTFHFDPAFILPDRNTVTMRTPFMTAYCQILVATCHKRGAHAIGGMAAFIPNRKEPSVTEKALEQVAQDKKREAGMGFDGSWVAHPDLIPVARAQFNEILGSRANQIQYTETPERLPWEWLKQTDIHEPITVWGVRSNIEVCLRYITHWLTGTGAVAIHNLMEDAATAEISRSQLWQWRTHAVQLSTGETMTAELYERFADIEMDRLREHFAIGSLQSARQILDELVLDSHFAEFLTLRAYAQI